jgi:hypothetical protein
VVRDAGHRHPRALGDIAGGEHNLQLAGRDLGIGVERLVEIAEAEEEDRPDTGV